MLLSVLYRYIISSPLLKEVNLEGNWIGDGGAREAMLALQQRKEVGLPPIRMSVSRRVCPEIFTAITELSASSDTKKGKGKKGKKVVVLAVLHRFFWQPQLKWVDQ